MTIEELTTELDGLLDPLDIPRAWPERQLNEYESRRASLARRIYAIQNSEATMTKVAPQIVTLTKWRDDLVGWRTTLVNELEVLPTPTTSLEVGKMFNLQLSVNMVDGVMPSGTGFELETLRLGALMRESGYVAAPPTEGQTFGKLPWFGSMPEVQRRIDEMTKRRDAAQAQLDEALLSDADREARAKEDKARRDALNALPQRKTRGDGTQYDKYPDGRRVEVLTAGTADE